LGSYKLAEIEASSARAKDVAAASQEAARALEPRIPKLTLRRGSGAPGPEGVVGGGGGSGGAGGGPAGDPGRARVRGDPARPKGVRGGGEARGRRVEGDRTCARTGRRACAERERERVRRAGEQRRAHVDGRGNSGSGVGLAGQDGRVRDRRSGG